MVKISQRDFNHDMDRYLGDRVQPKARAKKKMKRVDDSEFESVDREFGKKSFLQRLFSPIFSQDKEDENSIREIDEIEAELDEGIHEVDPAQEEYYEESEPDRRPRMPFISRLKNMFSGSYDEYETYDEVAPDPEPDLINLLKIQQRWLDKLPADKKKEFKTSEDFKTYKEVLKKYELIK